MSDRPSEPVGDLDSVRLRLRRLGYLDRSVDRYLLQDALRPERPVRTVILSSLKVGLLGGLPLAVAAAWVLARMNRLFVLAPGDLVLLFLHLVPPFVVSLGVGFLGLGGVLMLVLHLSHSRRIETASVALSTAAACLLLAVAALQGRRFLASLSPLQGLLAAVGGLVLGVALTRVLHGGLLTLAIRLRDRPPERRATRLVWQAAPVAISLGVLAAPALMFSPPPDGMPASLPALPNQRVVLIGVDGVRADEVDALLASGELPSFASRIAGGGLFASYRRDVISPAAFWTTVATGRSPADHGLVALDGYRPRGLRTTLTATGWLRPYFRIIGVRTGLVAHRPVLAPSRRVPALWDLASRGGLPVAVIDWWGTFPAEPLPGLMVAHGGYQLLTEGAEGAVEPAEVSPGLVRRAARVAETILLPSVLRPDLHRAVIDHALVPDAFYRRVFEEALGKAPRAAALYLPGLDIAAGLSDLSSIALAALVRAQLSSVDHLLASIGDDVETLAVVLDPGRRHGAASGKVEGRVLFFRRAGCVSAAPIEPAAVTSGLLRALGLPQSRELPPPPEACEWPLPSLTIDSFGPRHPPSPPAAGDDYLESLRSLGYL